MAQSPATLGRPVPRLERRAGMEPGTVGSMPLVGSWRARRVLALRGGWPPALADRLPGHRIG